MAEKHSRPFGFSSHRLRPVLLAGATLIGTAGLIRAASKKKGISTQAFLWLKLFDALNPFMKRHCWSIVNRLHLDGPRQFWRWQKKRADDCMEGKLGDLEAFITTPPEGAGTPLHILYLHGGDFVAGMMPYYGWMLSDLAHQLSCTIDMPLIPLAPSFQYETGMARILEAYKALEQEVGAENIVIMGDSAGGWLSYALVREIAQAKLPQAKAAILISPFLDLACMGVDQPDLEKNDPILDISFLREGGRMWAGERSLTDPKVNLITAPHQDGLPPIMVFTGTRDVLNSDARRLKEKEPWIVLEQYTGMPHIFPVGKRLPEAHHAIGRMIEFIRNPQKAETKEEQENLYETSRGFTWQIPVKKADPTLFSADLTRQAFEKKEGDWRSSKTSHTIDEDWDLAAEEDKKEDEKENEHSLSK
ncbi:alpha/beta hydrolase [Acetobacteraceae bacterium]|nr:alpha/beta hydrolase [Acetobacteraceae bacterium]